MTKILYRNSEKSFIECEINGFKKHLPALFPLEFFHVFMFVNFSKSSLVQINSKLNSKPYDYLYLYQSRRYERSYETPPRSRRSSIESLWRQNCRAASSGCTHFTTTGPRTRSVSCVNDRSLPLFPRSPMLSSKLMNRWKRYRNILITKCNLKFTTVVISQRCKTCELI